MAKVDANAIFQDEEKYHKAIELIILDKEKNKISPN